MKIKLADLDSTITAILGKIRDGVQVARNTGLICELPEKVDFQIEVITGYQTLEEVEENSREDNQTTTGQPTTTTTTTTKSGGGQTSTDTDRQTSNVETGTTDDGTATKNYS